MNQERVRARRQYGQHFLEPVWADRLVTAIDPHESDRFIEIGPGPGALTTRLAPRVAHLTAIELDAAMVAHLSPMLASNVTLLRADFLDLDLAATCGGQPSRVAGNLPYNVASPILFKLLGARRAGVPIVDATVMLQREVAERIEAAPGGRDYGTLSIFVQLRARVRRVMTLPPGAFRPQPKVHSAVLRLTFHEPAVAIEDEALFEAMVRSMFTQRRKTLGNALRPFADTQATDARAALETAGIDSRRRPETLQLTELARLADVLGAGRRRAVL